MKTRTFIGIVFAILLSTGFTDLASGQEYTYLLTVTSLSEEEQTFDLEIRSKIGSSSDPISIVLSNQTTPFERILETGEHVVIVDQEEDGGVVSKVTGIVGLEHRGFAASDDRKTYLTAGPGGRYSAGTKFK